MFALVGETLRRLRKERGKTLEQLGDQAGLGRGQLSRIENARQEATLSTLGKILEAQGVSRREYFRRYELVETEALARDSDGKPAHAASAASNWPDEVREALNKVESFLQTNLQQSRPVAQGAIEVGEYMVLFRVVSKDTPEARASEGTESPAEETEEGSGGKEGGPGNGAKPSRPRRPRGRGRSPRKGKR